MKILLISIMAFCAANIFAQSRTDLEKVVETEKAFARSAEERGIKPAFLEFLADDGVMFNPQQINGKEMWRARPESPALLSWYPVFADVSSNGVLGYTTGEGEYRPQGKTDTTVYYSTYATVWRKQPDGKLQSRFRCRNLARQTTGGWQELDIAKNDGKIFRRKQADCRRCDEFVFQYGDDQRISQSL